MATGFATQLAIDTELPARRGLEFDAVELRAQPSQRNNPGLGSGDAALATQAYPGTIAVGGRVRLFPTPADWLALLPWLVGPAGDDGNFAPVDQVATRYLVVDNTLEVLTYDQCAAARVEISAARQEPVTLHIDVIAHGETVGEASTFPPVIYGTGQPFLFGDATFTFAGAERPLERFHLRIDRQLRQRYVNSRLATWATPGKRVVTFEAWLPWTSETVDLHATPVPGPATLSLVQGAAWVVFRFDRWQPLPIAPTTPGRQFLGLALAGQVDRAGGAAELQVSVSGVT
ncbi:MAG: hypothetical protein JSS27_02550 [Planctomycetes bacterium]|nr:hypothetical protein [Planctomycetota bacterium]